MPFGMGQEGFEEDFDFDPEFDAAFDLPEDEPEEVVQEDKPKAEEPMKQVPEAMKQPVKKYPDVLDAFDPRKDVLGDVFRNTQAAIEKLSDDDTKSEASLHLTSAINTPLESIQQQIDKLAWLVFLQSEEGQAYVNLQQIAPNISPKAAGELHRAKKEHDAFIKSRSGPEKKKENIPADLKRAAAFWGMSVEDYVKEAKKHGKYGHGIRGEEIDI